MSIINDEQYNNLLAEVKENLAVEIESLKRSGRFVNAKNIGALKKVKKLIDNNYHLFDHQLKDDINKGFHYLAKESDKSNYVDALNIGVSRSIKNTKKIVETIMFELDTDKLKKFVPNVKDLSDYLVNQLNTAFFTDEIDLGQINDSMETIILRDAKKTINSEHFIHSKSTLQIKDNIDSIIEQSVYYSRYYVVELLFEKINDALHNKQNLKFDEYVLYIDRIIDKVKKITSYANGVLNSIDFVDLNNRTKDASILIEKDDNRTIEQKGLFEKAKLLEAEMQKPNPDMETVKMYKIGIDGIKAVTDLSESEIEKEIIDGTNAAISEKNAEESRKLNNVSISLDEPPVEEEKMSIGR